MTTLRMGNTVVTDVPVNEEIVSAFTHEVIDEKELTMGDATYRTYVVRNKQSGKTQTLSEKQYKQIFNGN